MDDFYKNVLRQERLYSLLAYVTSAMLTKDIGETDTFTEMLPVIKKDLKKLQKVVYPDAKIAKKGFNVFKR